ncbi:MAG: STAS domain-containing protein [Syntrophus sp. (in: bacteria)]
MRIEESRIGDVLVVKPMDRRIDASSAAAFKALLNDRIQGGQQRIVLNLSEVDFIDSTGLGAIVSSLKSMGEFGDLVISNPRETVMSLFRLTRMNRVFNILPSEEEALASLSKS